MTAAARQQSCATFGVVYKSLGQKRKALEYYVQALPIAREVGDRGAEASTLNNIGAACWSLGQQPKALDFYAQALAIRRAAGDRRGEATTLGAIGVVYDALALPQKALDYYAQALPIRREVGDRDGEARTLYNIGRVLRTLDSNRLAILPLKMSVNVYQSLRGDADPMGAGARRTYAEQSGWTYGELATCLSSDGRAPEAEQFLALSKTDARTATSVEAPYTEFEARWRSEFEARTVQLIDLAGKNPPRRALKAPTPAQADELKKLEAAKDGAEADFRRDFDRAIEESRQLDPAKNSVAETAASKSIAAALAELPPKTAIVYGLPDKDAVHLIVERRGRREVVRVPAPGFESIVTGFRAVLQHPDLDPRPLGKQLYGVLVKPIERVLDHHGVTAWYLAGSLRGIPIGALFDGNAYLTEKYPSASFSPAFVPVLAKLPSHRTGAVVAGVTAESRLPDPINGVPVSFAKLAAVREETSAAASSLGVKPMLDGHFTAKTLISSIKNHPEVIHLASHFRYVPGDDRRSFLLTGGNGAWTVDAIKSLPSNALNGVDLVTLSACATGEGESATGQESESFAAWMQRKGAGAVLSTLWPVADASTALLMGEFYRLRRAHPEWTKIEDLRQAQLGMLHGRLVGKGYEQTRSELGKQSASKLNAPPWPANLPKYAHPYYWAPFVLTGNWQ